MTFLPPKPTDWETLARELLAPSLQRVAQRQTVGLDCEPFEPYDMDAQDSLDKLTDAGRFDPPLYPSECQGCGETLDYRHHIINRTVDNPEGISVVRNATKRLDEWLCNACVIEQDVYDAEQVEAEIIERDFSARRDEQ